MFYHARQHNNIGQRGFIRRFLDLLLTPAEREPQRRWTSQRRWRRYARRVPC